jgi:oligopeptide/dipeptide ABC transporter ATP-binding protein
VSVTTPLSSPSTGQSGTTASAAPLLSITGLEVHFGRGSSLVRAVDDVTIDVHPGETVGLVGESGSGKSTIGRAVVGLAPVHAGTIQFLGRDITHVGRSERRRLSEHIQMVFQDPFSSLNPARTIEQTLVEPLLVHGGLNAAQRRERVREMLAAVEMPDYTVHRYPAQFSGGQRQRIAIARALMTSAQLVICDEPVSALDLSIQAQVLNLLADLRERFQTAYLFIAHDLAVVKHLSHRTVVLYKGRVMEVGPAAAVNAAPLHPYTVALVESAPLPDPFRQRARALARLDRVVGAAPRPIADARHACPFAPRCALAEERCWIERPALRPLGEGRSIACHVVGTSRSLPDGVQRPVESGLLS